MTRRHIQRAFSLVEVMVASMILSGAVVAICSISTRSFIGVKLNRDYEHAWDLLDRQLTMIDYVGVDQFLELGETSGICDGDTGETPHYWQVLIVEDEIPGLYVIQIAVTWQDGARARSVTARTKLNGAPILEEEEEQTPPEGEGAEASQGGPQGGSQGGDQGGSSTTGGRQGGSSTSGGSRGGGSSGGGGGNSRGGGGGGDSRGGGGGGNPRGGGGGRR